MSVKTIGAQVLPVQKKTFMWDSLPAIPDSVGFAGSFGGVAGGALIVAGGSNFPNGGAPWNGAAKKWYDKIFVLDEEGSSWKEAGKLPMPLGYGVSVSTKHGLLLIGGSNEKGHHAEVFMLRYNHGEVIIENYPSLPFALANTCGALVEDKIYLAGGLATPSSISSEKVFLSLDLQSNKKNWEQLPAWPGPSRMLSVAGAVKDCFFLFSGAELTNGKRNYLRDAWSYSEKNGWQKLPDLPFAVVAAPSPAFSNGKSKLFVFGGDTGEDAERSAMLKEMHPGFNKKILEYDLKKNEWSVAGEIDTKKEKDFVEKPNNSVWAPVTTSLVVWNDQIVLPGGEVRPATRTPNVLIAKPVKD